MTIKTSDKLIAWLALLSGLSISAVAIFYSVAGLVSIFAAAVVPIVVMGVVLETGKLVATVWLKQNWSIAPRPLKIYLLIAIGVLMIITSMGIFGYLSKAHLDQSVPTGDIAAQVSLIDEKIKTEKENIDAARKALAQMDSQVNERLARSSDEQGAERAAQLRRAQQRERAQLQKDIATAQTNISRLNEQRAPIAKELRKVEAEVGPVKYIAALIYGDNPDQNLLEAAVRWVIIVIVLVFDPLAVILLLASQYSFQWFRRNKEETEKDLVDKESIQDRKSEEQTKDDFLPTYEEITPKPEEPKPHHPDTHPYLRQGFKTPEGWGTVPPQVYRPDEEEDNKHDDQILDNAAESEKAAMKQWKLENPNGSLKQQRKLFDKGIITSLPWDEYLKPKADYIEEKIDIDKHQSSEDVSADDSKKKDSGMDRKVGESTDKENPRDIGYVQNAEQNRSTLWQRVKARKNDK